MDGYSKKLSSVAAVCNFPREVESFPIRYSGTQRAVFVTEVGRTDDLSVATNDLLVKITEDKSRSRIKNRRQVWRSVRSLLTAVRVAAGIFRESQSGAKIKGGDTISVVVFPKSLLLQEKSRRHALEKILS